MTLTTLSNERGTSIVLSTFGARLVELMFRDREGNVENIVLGYDTEQNYRDNPDWYVGATVGRVAGRLAGARFIGGGLNFPTTPNEGTSHLHGGPNRALDRVEWEAMASTTANTVVFRYVSPAEEEGYPGTLKITSSYQLTESDELVFELRATTDAATPVNLVNHTYLNLSGGARRSIVDHELMINADSILEADVNLLPRGGVIALSGMAYDFREERRIGNALPENGSEPWPGIDSTYLLAVHAKPVATLRDPVSGRVLRITTTEPALQVYTGNRIAIETGRSDGQHGPGKGICLEAQRVPDSPQLPGWPTIVIEPGTEYHQRTVWSLGTS
jgi:aldose 1-epimerase